ncbi:MAG TPA: KEOPS complex subunit Pcc1 [Methanobacteriaceae archaeon]|nr:KEOPS complex subunit Pcc1 [Methanobacteriaceae archaeon]
MEILQGVEIQLEFELKTPKEAENILEAIKPEISSAPSSRTSSKISIDGRKITLEIKASDSTSLRASVNSYLRWIILSTQIMGLK